jgi:3'(2'), 5'-bisphosphate nucleotidase
MSDDELLEAMIGAAVAAGGVVLEIYQRGSARELDVRTKADSSPVTLADRTAEAIVLERLADCAGGTPVVAEEEVAAGRVPVVREEFFLVDPLDGTKEFIARRGEFTVNIALTRHGVPVLGVVYAPTLGRMYAANAITGRAFREDFRLGSREPGARTPIHVRTAPAAGITAVASRSHSSAETETYLARYRVSERISIGSSLKFCLIAEGRADLYPRLGPTMEWDTAAGHAVLLGAGGSVIAAKGGALAYGKPQFRNSWFVASGGLEPRPIGS